MAPSLYRQYASVRGESHTARGCGAPVCERGSVGLFEWKGQVEITALGGVVAVCGVWPIKSNAHSAEETYVGSRTAVLLGLSHQRRSRQ